MALMHRSSPCPADQPALRTSPLDLCHYHLSVRPRPRCAAPPLQIARRSFTLDLPSAPSMDKTDMLDSQSAPLLGSAPTSRAAFDRRPSRRTLCLGLAGLAAIVAVSLSLSRMLDSLRRPSADPTHPFGLSTHVSRSLGLYSPWQPAAAASDYAVPRGCVVTQVNVVRPGLARCCRRLRS